MKIYTMNCGWAGSIVVVANSKDEAAAIMKDEYNYSEGDPIEEHEIENGFCFANYGDM